jgi:hypothetical protein
VSLTNRNHNKPTGPSAVLALTFCLACAHSALGQSANPNPLRTVVPVHLDGSNGNITVGSKVYMGRNPGMHQ